MSRPSTQLAAAAASLGVPALRLAGAECGGGIVILGFCTLKKNKKNSPSKDFSPAPKCYKASAEEAAKKYWLLCKP